MVVLFTVKEGAHAPSEIDFSTHLDILATTPLTEPEERFSNNISQEEPCAPGITSTEMESPDSRRRKEKKGRSFLVSLRTYLPLHTTQCMFIAESEPINDWGLEPTISFSL